MVPAGNKTKHFLLVNHTTKTIHHHHCHHQLTLVKPNVIQKLDGMNILIQLKFWTTETPLKQHWQLFYIDCVISNPPKIPGNREIFETSNTTGENLLSMNIRTKIRLVLIGNGSTEWLMTKFKLPGRKWVCLFFFSGFWIVTNCS